MKGRKRGSYLKYYAIFLLIFTVVVGSMAKYRTTLATTETGGVAVPVLSLVSDDNSVLILMNPTEPSDEQDFVFDVSNKDEDNKINEVTMKYTLSLRQLESLPLDVTLYEYDDATSEYTIVNLTDGKTTEEELIIDEEQSKRYKLHIKWQDNKTDYRYNKTIDYIKIVADAKQVD